MSELTAAGVMELLEGTSMVTLQSILEVLGLGEEAAKIDPTALNKPLQTQENVAETVRLLFANPRLRGLIEAGCKENFELAAGYLTGLAGGATCIGILDIGWGGSIQRNITRILRRKNNGIRTVGCYLARTRKSGRLWLDGDEMHAFMEQDWSRSTILPELAITSPVGSTNGYRRDAKGIISPVLGAYESAPGERQVKARLREGILDFQSLWLALLKHKNHSAETLADIDGQTASIFYRLLEYPTKAEADRLGVLTHDENYFGENFNAPLCDDETPRRLQQDGIQAVFQSARCYWPQGVVARNNPRLITSLRSGWSDYLTLGRLGAWHSTSGVESRFTDEEITTLGLLIQSIAPRQIVFIGPVSPVLREVLGQSWWQSGTSDEAPRVIIAGLADTKKSAGEFSSGCVLVAGELDEITTVEAIRKKFAAGGNIALVLPGDLPEATVKGLINGLAPFLGEEGAILTACGRFDRNTVSETLPAGKVINDWLQGNGRELGFGLWLGDASLRAALCNWVIFRRARARMVWNNQWTFTATDLAFADESTGLLTGKP